MKTILITGASTGIGKETALLFAKNNWNVIATMRKPENETAFAAYSNVLLTSLDVMDEQSIQAAIEKGLEKFGKIDALFNNAGYALVGALEGMSAEQIKKQFDTNVFGLLNVTKAILPHFRANKAGMILNTSSMGGRITFPLYSIYHGTKWAVEGIMESLQFELNQHNIKVKNIEPGAIKTNFESAINFVSHPAYENYAPRVHQNMLDTYDSAPGPEVVAKKVFKVANSTGNKMRFPVGGLGPVLIVLRWLLPLNWFLKLVRMSTEKGVK